MLFWPSKVQYSFLRNKVYAPFTPLERDGKNRKHQLLIEGGVKPVKKPLSNGVYFSIPIGRLIG